MQRCKIVFRFLTFVLLLSSGYSNAYNCDYSYDQISLPYLNKEIKSFSLNSGCYDSTGNTDYTVISKFNLNPELIKAGVKVELLLNSDIYVDAASFDWKAWKQTYPIASSKPVPHFKAIRIDASNSKITKSVVIPGGANSIIEYDTKQCWLYDGTCSPYSTSFSIRNRFDMKIHNCEVRNSNVVVKLPAVSESTFSKIGVVAANTQFNLGYSCSDAVISSVQLDGTADATAGKTVLASQTGTGYASGVGIQFVDDKGAVIELGKPYPFSAGGTSAEKIFSARYYQTKSAVTPGLVKGTATVTYTFQ